MPTVTIYEFVGCEGRGNHAPAAIRHVITCTDPSDARALDFELPAGVSPPLVGGELDER
jgi:hypothetical protein